MGQYQRFLKGIILLSVLLLTGCSFFSNPQKPTHVISLRTASSGYRCVVINAQPSGEDTAVWSAHKEQAQSQAIKRCRARSRYPNACQIQQCRWHRKKPAQAALPWYTCYVENKQHSSLWHDTSHVRFRATSGAFARCRKSSGKPEDCYLKYCHVW